MGFFVLAVCLLFLIPEQTPYKPDLDLDFRFIVYCVLRVSVRGIELNYFLRGAFLPGFWGYRVWFSGPWVFGSLGFYWFRFSRLFRSGSSEIIRAPEGEVSEGVSLSDLLYLLNSNII